MSEENRYPTEFSVPLKNSYRMVFLGSSKVGKTSIIRRFLYDDFSERHYPTIDEFHCKSYLIHGEQYKLELYDSSGIDPFPAMKRTWLALCMRIKIFFLQYKKKNAGA